MAAFPSVSYRERKFYVLSVLFVFALALVRSASAQSECSLSKTNKNCTLTIDRSNRRDAASGGCNGAVGIEFNTVLLCLCSVGQLMGRDSCADTWIDDACGSCRELQQFSQALGFLLRQRVVP
jgi:hypothetical protein